jgi:hypothetical protein
MSDFVELHFRYTEAEYVSAIQAYLLSRPRLTFYLVIAAVSFLLGLYFLLAGYAEVLSFSLLSCGTFLLAMFTVSMLLLPRRRFQSDPKFQDEYCLRFSEDGIVFKTAHVDAKLEWSLYTEALETRKYYLLVYGKGAVSVVPKRVFNDAQQEELFRNLIARRIGHGAKLAKWQALPVLEQESNYVPPAEPPDWR